MKKYVFAILLILTVWYRPSLAQNSPELVLPAGHTSGILSLDFSPDGKHIVTGSADYTVKIWETVSGRLLHTFDNHNGWVVVTQYNKTEPNTHSFKRQHSEFNKCRNRQINQKSQL
jgi:WD40 repeat protein